MHNLINALRELLIYRKCPHEWEYLCHERKSDGEPIPYFRECQKCGKKEAVD